ncbi:MAG: DNA-formamidopyrimidine glycosylase family protein [Ornithinimicrobium sp.]
MPEGDAVWRTARRLHTALAGEEIVRSDLRVPSLATVDLSGRRSIAVGPRGKHLLHRIEGDLTLHSHLRMEGRWWTFRTASHSASADPSRHTVRAVLHTPTWTAIADSLGMLDLARTSHEDRIVGHLGPDLLDPGFDQVLALDNVMGAPARTITEALLDQRNLAGIGTIFASEPLFLHGINPWSPVGTIGGSEVAEVIDTARSLLISSCRLGRTTITGRSDQLDDAWVHGRVGLACKRCSRPIRLATIGTQPQERVMFYCARCQQGLAPTDDGEPQQPLGHGRKRQQ